MHNLKPKKYLGQHFLTDRRIAEKIVETLGATHDDVVVEIGPGQGVLTALLIPRYPALRVVEVDADAVAYLRSHFMDDNLHIIHADILKWQMEGDIPHDSFFIGNLPYNISSPIFFRVLAHLPFVKMGVFMIQKEVAERICAQPGNKTYGILSVLLGAYFHLSYEFSVPPGVFRPPPKVMSGVLSMVRKDPLPAIPFSNLKRVVKQAFNQRRKTLRNALKSLTFKPFEEKEEWMTKRAEQLSVAQFIRLTAYLSD